MKSRISRLPHQHQVLGSPIGLDVEMRNISRVGRLNPRIAVGEIAEELNIVPDLAVYLSTNKHLNARKICVASVIEDIGGPHSPVLIRLVVELSHLHFGEVDGKEGVPLVVDGRHKHLVAEEPHFPSKVRVDEGDGVIEEWRFILNKLTDRASAQKSGLSIDDL